MATLAPTHRISDSTIACNLTFAPPPPHQALVDETRAYLQEHRACFDGHIAAEDILNQIRHRYTTYDAVADLLRQRLGTGRPFRRARQALHKHIATHYAHVLQESAQ